MRNLIVTGAALLLLSGGAFAQTGAGASGSSSTVGSGTVRGGATVNDQDSACRHVTDADERTRCLNNLQLQRRDSASGGMGGTGVTGSAGASGGAGVGGRALGGGTQGSSGSGR
jgi:hypothetical protein